MNTRSLSSRSPSARAVRKGFLDVVDQAARQGSRALSHATAHPTQAALIGAAVGAAVLGLFAAVFRRRL